MSYIEKMPMKCIINMNTNECLQTFSAHNKILLQEKNINQITKTAWDLNEKAPNRYQLVYEIAELSKKLVDENQLKRVKDEYSFDEVPFDTSIKKENPVEHAIMVKASESDDDGLVG